MHVVVYPTLSSLWTLKTFYSSPFSDFYCRATTEWKGWRNSLKVRAPYNRWKVHKKELGEIFYDLQKKSSTSKSNNATERAHVRSVDFEWNAACGALNHSRRAAVVRVGGSKMRRVVSIECLNGEKQKRKLNYFMTKEKLPAVAWHSTIAQHTHNAHNKWNRNDWY